jgi:hypothetical protein
MSLGVQVLSHIFLRQKPTKVSLGVSVMAHSASLSAYLFVYECQIPAEGVSRRVTLVAMY